MSTFQVNSPNFNISNITIPNNIPSNITSNIPNITIPNNGINIPNNINTNNITTTNIPVNIPVNTTTNITNKTSSTRSKKPVELTAITKEYSVNSITYNNLKAAYLDKTLPLNNITNVELLNPTLSNYINPQGVNYMDCLIINNTSKNENLLLFDKHILSVKLIDYSINNVNEKLYAVSINDLMSIYGIHPSRVKAFKNHYKFIDPTTVHDPKEIINTSKYPLTNKGTSKWLVISYLVPFLMYCSTDFNNRMSNFLFRLLSYSTLFESTLSIDNIYSVINSINQSNPPKFVRQTELTLTPIKSEHKTKTIVPTDDEEYLILTKQKYIIPNYLDNIPDYQKQTNIFNTFNQTKDIVKYYNDIDYKLYNPADITYIKSIKGKEGLKNMIAIVKISPNDIENGQIKQDSETFKTLYGIKSKDVKVTIKQTDPSTNKIISNTVTNRYYSQQTQDIKIVKIPKGITLANILNYIYDNNNNPQKNKINVDLITSQPKGKNSTKLSLKLSRNDDATFDEISKIIPSIDFQTYLQEHKTKSTKQPKNITTTNITPQTPTVQNIIEEVDNNVNIDLTQLNNNAFDPNAYTQASNIDVIDI
jgi:hypothetical protein